MKQASIFFILVLIFLLSSCQNNSSIVSQGSEQIGKFCSANGILYGVIGTDTLYAGSATIFIDNARKSYADSIGRYHIDSIVTGSHILSIVHNSFFQFDTAINFNNSMSLSFKLTPKIADYLPLKLGNRWTYTYEYNWGYMPTGQSTNIDGTFVWEIISLVKINSSNRFKIEETYDYTRIDNSGIPNNHVDTTYGHTTGSFCFVEDKNHIVTIDSVVNSVLVSTLPYNFSVIRYNKTTNGTNRMFISYPTDAFTNNIDTWFTRDIGIDSWRYHHVGNHYWSYTVTLSSYLVTH